MSAHTTLAVTPELRKHTQDTSLQTANLLALTTSQMSSYIFQAEQRAWAWASVGAPQGSSTQADTSAVSRFMKGSH